MRHRGFAAPERPKETGEEKVRVERSRIERDRGLELIGGLVEFSAEHEGLTARCMRLGQRRFDGHGPAARILGAVAERFVANVIEVEITHGVGDPAPAQRKRWLDRYGTGIDLARGLEAAAHFLMRKLAA